MHLFLAITLLWTSTVISSAIPSTPRKTIAGVTVVDTPLVQAAQQYARNHSDDMTYNHVIRSWLFGVTIYDRLHQQGKIPTVDLEVHALSAILHDLGWDNTGELISSDKRFEVDGAIAARAWIEQKKVEKVGYLDAHETQLVWDSIALHTTPSISAFKEPVVALTGMGIVADFQGPKSDASGTITFADFDAFKAAFPRNDLAKGVQDIIDGFCRTKPNTTYDNFQQAFGERFVKNYTTRGHLEIDIIEGSLP